MTKTFLMHECLRGHDVKPEDFTALIKEGKIIPITEEAAEDIENFVEEAVSSLCGDKPKPSPVEESSNSSFPPIVAQLEELIRQIKEGEITAINSEQERLDSPWDSDPVHAIAQPMRIKYSVELIVNR